MSNNNMNQGYEVNLSLTRTRRSPDEDWMKHIYQLKRRLKLLLQWCDTKYIDEGSFLIVLDEVINGEVDEVSLRQRLDDHKIK